MQIHYFYLKILLFLKIFILTFIHYLLYSIIKHRCKVFHVEIFQSQFTISELIELLAPYVMLLRSQCSSCYSSIPNVSIADIAYLLIKNKSNQWSIAIDMNVLWQESTISII